MLSPQPCVDRGAVDSDEDVAVVPGDTYGFVDTRCNFYRPTPRQTHKDELGALMPAGTHPLQCVNARTVRALCGRLGVTADEAVAAMRATACDVNAATHALVQRKQQQQRQEAASDATGCLDHRAYGLVCLEAYAPETFCLVSYTLPSFAATRDDDVLDVLHELTLSAAELPLDTAPDALMQRFVRDWTTNDDTPCAALLDEYDIGVRELVLLPYGEYAVQGFSILHAVSPTTPNIGTAAVACCLDLRTGIHNRFRFHVERMADSLSEHVLREQVHYDEGVHVLRQPYWFRPEYSVEDYIRFKEDVLKPSAVVHEMRYAAMYAAPYDLPGYRNRVELERLFLTQQRHGMCISDLASFSRGQTDDGSLQTVANAHGATSAVGASAHSGSNSAHTAACSYETEAAPLRTMLSSSTPQAYIDSVFAPFYRNHYF